MRKLTKKGDILIMKTKKIIAGAVTLLAAATLAACSSSADKDIISMKGATFTV